jgi:GntR family transcriptional repressor for pyruvate dehydrogenase complex
MMNSTINKQTLSEIVVSKIKKHIIDNDLKAGDRLPTEQEMAGSFGVSRLSVREATTTLSYLGIIDSAPRRGLTVGKFDLDRLKEFLGFHFALNDYPREKLLYTRVVIEVGILGYSSKAIIADKGVYDKLDEICNEIDKYDSLDSYIHWDIEFHSMLVKVAGIEPLVMFNDLLQTFFRKFRLEISNIGRYRDKGLNVHREILESLRCGNVDQAENLLREHLGCYKEKIQNG